MKQDQGPKKEERRGDHMMRGTGMLSQSGTMQPRPPRPPMGSGAMMGSGRVQGHYLPENKDRPMPGTNRKLPPTLGSGSTMMGSGRVQGHQECFAPGSCGQ